MLFIKELKKICFSFIYVLFIGLLLFSWHENFYGVTTKEITGSQGNDDYSYDYYIRKYYAASKLQFSIFKICNRDNSVCCFSGDFRTSFFTIRK